jgi:hypothetical protein
MGASMMTYSSNFSKNYPLPIVDHVSLDAKLKFIRERVNIKEIDTIIVGSSLALNNVQGVILEEQSTKCKHVLSLTAWSIGPAEVEQLLELVPVFPKLKRIIYSAQFTSFNFGSKFKKFDSDFLKKYISNSLNPLEYSIFIANACKDISFCKNREKVWDEKYMDNKKYSYLDFDHTGSAPLNVYGKDITPSRWDRADGSTQNPLALKALHRMADKANKNNIKFYLIQQPYRQAMIDKHQNVAKIMKVFPVMIGNILKKYNGVFFNLHEKLHLSDAHFADRSHLNDKGSRVGTEEIAKFIDKSEKK